MDAGEDGVLLMAMKLNTYMFCMGFLWTAFFAMDTAN
jgi:hypothetical protein